MEKVSFALNKRKKEIKKGRRKEKKGRKERRKKSDLVKHYKVGE